MDRRTDIVRLRVMRENFTLWLMSVIREQIFQALAAFQERPIRCHYPSLYVSLFSGLGPFVSHKNYTAIYWR